MNGEQMMRGSQVRGERVFGRGEEEERLRSILRKKRKKKL